MKLTKKRALEIAIERDERGKFVKGHTGFRDNQNGLWKGDNAKYSTIHEWLRLRLGTPSNCSACGSTTAKRYEWANLSGQYMRELSDWVRLCASCHRLKDGNGTKAWIIRRRKLNEIDT